VTKSKMEITCGRIRTKNKSSGIMHYAETKRMW